MNEFESGHDENKAANILALRKEIIEKTAVIDHIREELRLAQRELSQETCKGIFETGKNVGHLEGLEKEVQGLRRENDLGKETMNNLRENLKELLKKLDVIEEERANFEAEAQAAKSCLEIKDLELQRANRGLEKANEVISEQISQLEKVEISTRLQEEERFRLQNLVRIKEDMRIESESRTKELEATVEELSSSRRAARARAETLSRDIARILELSNSNDLSRVEELLVEHGQIKARLVAREAEKADLLLENAALRQKAQTQFLDLQKSAIGGAPKLQLGESGIEEALSPTPRKLSSPEVEDVRHLAISSSTSENNPRVGRRRLTFLDSFGALKESLKTDHGKLTAAQAQASQLRALANSLLEVVNEKDLLLKEQRFANKKLAEKISELEKDLARWRR